MVQIRISPEKKEIEIKMPVFYLYEIIDNDEWLSTVLEKCKELIIEEFEKEGLNRLEKECKKEGEREKEAERQTEGGDEPEPADPRPPNP